MLTSQSYSRIIAGTMTWGQWGKKLTEPAMLQQIQQCMDLGITTFDHADIYGGYTNESDFGKALAKADIDRESIQLISKCGIQFKCEARPHPIGHYQYDKEYIVAQVEASLVKLQTDYLDMFLLHRPSPLMHPDEIAEAITTLRDSGKIIDFGVSNFTPSQATMVHSRVPVQSNQVECSLPEVSALYNGSLDDCIQNNRMAMAWSPLGGYFQSDSEKKQRIAIQLELLTKKYDVSENQLLLAWLLQHPAKIHPVIGTTNLKRIQDSQEALSLELELIDWFQLLKATNGHDVP